MAPSDLYDSKHPIWNIIRLVVVFAGFTILMYLNSKSFDETEVKTLLEMIGLVAGFEYARIRVGKNGNGAAPPK